MNDEDTIFADALAITSARERRDFLDKSCGGDAGLRARLEVLLAAHERAGSFLESPPIGLPTAEAGAATAAAPAPSERPGAVVGPYKLLEQIGEGGMGVVFMAEQLRPVRRRVALKIIKPGMDTKQVIARFDAERQALALMDHPNIAKVLEAGATDAGRPYFVMELVRGVPITDYCDQLKLSPRQRLELFVQVCQAVQHAHTKGIIHRDLKPTNVLVTVSDDGRPIPKVIDFGIAKATAGQPLTPHTLFTELRQLVGTPLYMSPEQAEMSRVQDVDTRSDVYSLGVLLYELLTGTTPFDKQRLGKAAHDEIRRIIREEDPPRPSTRISTLGETLTTVSAQRQTDPGKLSAIIRGELDWIVMRALEKDRGRRYETAVGFARDVERYLADQPVEACPPSRFYRVHKFARRNKAALATTSLVAAVLVAATAYSTWQVVRARRAERQVKDERDQVLAQKRRADEQSAIAKAINEFLNKDVLGQANVLNQLEKTNAPDRDLKVRDALDRAAAGVASRFANQPLTEAAIHSTLGDAYSELGEYQKAERHLQAALRTQRQLLGDAHPDTRETLLNLAAMYSRMFQLDKTEALLGPALQDQQKTLGRQHRDTLRTMSLLGATYVDLAKFDQAERLLSDALDRQRSVLGEVDRETLDTSTYLAFLYEKRGKYAEAESLLLKQMDIYRKTNREHTPMSLGTRYILGKVYVREGLYPKAEQTFQEQLADKRTMEGPTGEFYILRELSELYHFQGRYSDAEQTAIKALAMTRKELGEQHPLAFQALSTLGNLYANEGKPAKAQELLSQALEGARKLYGDNDVRTARHLRDLGLLYEGEYQHDKARTLLLRALELDRQVYGDQHPDTLTDMSWLGAYYSRQGDVVKAEQLVQQSIEGLRKLLGEHHPETLQAMEKLTEVYEEARRFADAETLCRKLLALTQEARGPESRDAGICWRKLAHAVRSAGRRDEARQLCQQAVAILRKHGDSLALAEALEELAMTVRMQEAEDLLREAVVMRKKVLGPEHPEMAPALLNYGQVLGLQKRYPEAKPVLLEALNIQQRTYPPGHPYVAWAKYQLGKVLTLNGDYAEAQTLLTEAADVILTDTTVMKAFHRQDALEQVIALYTAWGKPDRAEYWRAKGLEADITRITRTIDAGGDANPKLPGLLMDRARLYMQLGDRSKADADLAQISQLGVADDPGLIQTRALRDVVTGDFQHAAIQYARAQALDPGDHWIWFKYGCLLAYNKDYKAYRELCDAMVQRFGNAPDPNIADRVIKTALLLKPNDPEQARTLRYRLEPLLRVLEKGGDNPWRLQVRGMYQYRAANYEEAIRLLRRSIETFEVDHSSRMGGAPTSHLFLAMALHASGGDEKMVNEEVRAALDIMDKGPIRDDHFQDRLVIHVALREVRPALNLPIPTTSLLDTQPTVSTTQSGGVKD